MCDRHKVMQLNSIIRGRWRTDSCWHKFQWLQFTLTVNWDGVVERNVSSGWHLKSTEKIVAIWITGRMAIAESFLFHRNIMNS